jgi:hypothetical protein
LRPRWRSETLGLRKMRLEGLNRKTEGLFFLRVEAQKGGAGVYLM